MNEKYDLESESEFGAKFIDTLTSYHKTISNLSAPNEMNFRRPTSSFTCFHSLSSFMIKM